jgi:hypothetical protein
MVIFGQHVPVEKHRDSKMLLSILYSAAPYSLNKENMEMILTADPAENAVYLNGLAKNAQQVIRYTLYGFVNNYMRERYCLSRQQCQIASRLDCHKRTEESHGLVILFS